jgi:hypothetical protein
MPIIEGWEVSPNRIEKYEKIVSSDQVGEPILTSKCALNNDNGFLIVSENGIAWRIKVSAGQVFQMGAMSAALSGKSKWIRWCDVFYIEPKKKGQILVAIKKRQNGILNLDKKGNYRLNKWTLTIKPNSEETGENFSDRQRSFKSIMFEIFDQYKVEDDPPTSDSRM